MGKACAHRCPKTMWGSGCDMVCGCKRGYCDSETGNCDCPVGWYGQWCEKPCDSGFYGKGCKKRCRCGIGKCDILTGLCVCPYGWTGIYCNKKILSIIANTTTASATAQMMSTLDTKFEAINNTLIESIVVDNNNNDWTFMAIASIFAILLAMVVLGSVVYIIVRHYRLGQLTNNKRNSMTTTTTTTTITHVDNPAYTIPVPQPHPRTTQTPTKCESVAEQNFYHTIQELREKIGKTKNENIYEEIHGEVKNVETKSGQLADKQSMDTKCGTEADSEVTNLKQRPIIPPKPVNYLNNKF
ncbi:multiple epidermal growth factor-like domains protein 10 [Oppia nitens]|uniref:multiple epidermal growth factor-like domains protein 10 n=1 Tax=Oppia nitens TaxID=1686743 RepID=UPI0023DC160B|nr:multiple epidermal growth factor-like domains protein 10 [Oppia nitens]